MVAISQWLVLFFGVMVFLSGLLCAILVFWQFLYLPVMARMQQVEEHHRLAHLAARETAKMRTVLTDPVEIQRQRGQLFKYRPKQVVH